MVCSCNRHCSLSQKGGHTIVVGRSHRKHSYCGISCDYSDYVHSKYCDRNMLNKSMNSSVARFRHTPNNKDVHYIK